MTAILRSRSSILLPPESPYVTS